MPYANPETMDEIANILEDFNVEELIDLFKSQITAEGAITAIPTNHFHPLYRAYIRATSIEDVVEDDIDEIKKRFYNICLNIIQLICTKYRISVEEDWEEDEFIRLPAFTMSLYQFFVIDTFYILLETLNNYIGKNIDDLFNAFAEVLQQKDVTTSTNLRSIQPKYAAIASSIYDVTDYAFTMLDAEEFFTYIDPKYVPGEILHQMYEKGYISGDFIRAFADIYKEDLSLRSKISYELVQRIRTNQMLTNNPIIITNAEIKQLNDEEEKLAAERESVDNDTDIDEE